MRFANIEERDIYLKSLLTEAECSRLFQLKNEWYDCGLYDSDEEIMEEHFDIQICHKGYDLLYKSFYCVVLYQFHMPEYAIRVYKFIPFKNLNDYIDFVEDIYANASYFGYKFSAQEISHFNIDITKINTNAFYDKTYKNERGMEAVDLMTHRFWDFNKQRKSKLALLCSSFLDYDSYDDFISVNSEVNDAQFLIAAEYAMTRKPDKTFSILDTYHGQLSYNIEQYAQYYFKDPQLYQKYSRRDVWLEQFQIMSKICKPSVTNDTTFHESSQIGFDKDNYMFYIFHQASYDDTSLSFKEWFLTIDELAKALNNDLSNADFSDCYDDIDWSKYNISNAIIPIGQTKRVFEVELYKDDFKCEMKFMRGNAEVSANLNTFHCIRDVIHYLDYDNHMDKIDKLCDSILKTGKYMVNID